MRIFFTILITVFIFCQSSFAISAKDKKKQQESQQKMEQLRDLIKRASQSGATAAAGTASLPENDASGAKLPDTLNQSNDAMSAPAISQAPSAGLVSAASAVAQVDDQQSSSVPAATGAANNTQPNLYDQAFSGVVNQLLPMSPQQIAKLREVFTESQLAAATPPGVPPKPTSTSLMVDLSTKAVPPVIRLGAGYISSIVFVDATGQPWPIAAYSIGDPSAFNIQWDKKGNTLLIQGATFYKRSNLAVILRDLNTPVMMTLISGQEAVDYRVDLRVPGMGPNAIFVQDGIPEAVNPMLLDVLNGIPPKGSKEIKVRGGDCQAWLLNGKLYLRTNLNVISPGWQSIMSSIDGKHAYQLQPSPVILTLQNGRDKILTLTLEGL
ncbi:MAG TPA: type IV secretion protein IcmK [Coxiellaceae bacterium]|nr:type IV secretion protein IcmK [Coxiellaceae bacterium]